MTSKHRQRGSKSTDDIAEKKSMGQGSQGGIDDYTPRSAQSAQGLTGMAHRNAGPNPSLSGAESGPGFGGSVEGERGGPGVQQAGWSSRQQAERMRARADEAREGQPQRSGYGGAEQKQHAGSQESSIGPAGSQQSGEGGTRQSERGATPNPARAGSGAPQKPSDSGSRKR